ncbi:hypothetical protein chiPu_0012813 [Chiloscyllium punctatum]|uniref:Uncharacterized protein n=1 Tax=Chiloscyllium punctatum TaxID=137246 RepID=A0A401SVD2_CHIPU|nr:hypothetical protein [Chiloscyllium punctatum]
MFRVGRAPRTVPGGRHVSYWQGPRPLPAGAMFIAGAPEAGGGGGTAAFGSTVGGVSIIAADCRSQTRSWYWFYRYYIAKKPTILLTNQR